MRLDHTNAGVVGEDGNECLHDFKANDVDDAANGLRGLRAKPSPALFGVLRDCYGIDSAEGVTDLGGSSNLNLLVCVGPRQYVVRVYRPYVTSARLSDIHLVRRALARGGVPCSSVMGTREGEPWTQLGDRLVEVEDYVERDAKMDSWERLLAGLPLLGRIHTLLGHVKVSASGATPVFANHVEPQDALSWTMRAARRIQAWNPSPAQMHLAQLAEELAQAVGDAEREVTPSLPRQLVHGDFWDNNVFFRDGRVVFVADFDFMGERARIDDLALTLYFASLSLGRKTSSPSALANCVGLSMPTTQAWMNHSRVRSGLRCRWQWRASRCGPSDGGWHCWTTRAMRGGWPRRCLMMWIGLCASCTI